MSSTATLKAPFSPESPEQVVELRIGTTLARHINSQRSTQWSAEDRRVAIACVKYLAHGTPSDASQQPSDNRRVRFNHLSMSQSDLLHCLYMEVKAWDEPTLDALTSQLPR